MSQTVSLTGRVVVPHPPNSPRIWSLPTRHRDGHAGMASARRPSRRSGPLEGRLGGEMSRGKNWGKKQILELGFEMFWDVLVGFDGFWKLIFRILGWWMLLPHCVLRFPKQFRCHLNVLFGACGDCSDCVAGMAGIVFYGWCRGEIMNTAAKTPHPLRFSVL